MKRLTRNPRIISAVVAFLIRVIGATLRVRIDDRTGIRDRESAPNGPVIWAFWHNRIFVLPYIYRKYLPHRQGSVLTSASRDGEIIAQVMERFGVEAVRGSSSKGGSAAYRASLRVVRAKDDLVVTPDGPRGPRYQLQPGMIKLAAKTGTPVFPIAVKFGCCIRLTTWDAFRIPLPFSRIDVILGEFQNIPPDLDEPALAAQRDRIADLLHHPDDPPPPPSESTPTES